MVSKLMIPGAFDYHYKNCKMESRVENLGRSLLEGRKVNQIRLEEIKQLWKRRKGDYSRRRSRRDHAPSRCRQTPNGPESISKLIDRALLLTEKNDALSRGGPAVEDAQTSGLKLDSDPLIAQGSSNLQRWVIDPISHIPTEIAKEKKDMEEEDEGREGDGSISSNFFTVTEIEKHMKGELKATKEFSKEEEKLRAVHMEEIEVKGVGGDVSDLSEMKTENQSGGCSRNDGDRCVGGGRGSLVELMRGGGRVTPPPEPPDLGVPKAEVDSSSLVDELPPSALPCHYPCLAAVMTVLVKVRMEELPPPEPPDMGVYMEAGGSLVAAEGGSSPAVVKLSFPSMAEITNACEREKGARAAVEEVGQTFGQLDQAQRVEIQMAIERLMREEVKLHKRGQFLYLMGQAHIPLLNWDNDKKGLRSPLKQHSGPVFKTGYRAQFTKERKRFQEEWKLNLVVAVIPNCNIFVAVYQKMVSTRGVCAILFSALAEANVNVCAIAQGCSEYNITVVVRQEDCMKALRAVHSRFYISRTTTAMDIIGPGLIGSTLLEQLRNQGAVLEKEFYIDLHVMGIMGSKLMLLNDVGINLVKWGELLEEKREEANLENFVEQVHGNKLMPNTALVDCTADSIIATHYKEWFCKGIHIINPNKKASSGPLNQYLRLRVLKRQSYPRYFYPFVSEEWELQAQPEEALAVRGNSVADLEVLVKWKNLPSCENSWEKMASMQELFPEFHLEDKVNLKGAGIDADIRPTKDKVYERGKWRSTKWFKVHKAPDHAMPM